MTRNAWLLVALIAQLVILDGVLFMIAVGYHPPSVIVSASVMALLTLTTAAIIVSSVLLILEITPDRESHAE